MFYQSTKTTSLSHLVTVTFFTFFCPYHLHQCFSPKLLRFNVEINGGQSLMSLNCVFTDHVNVVSHFYLSTKVWVRPKVTFKFWHHTSEEMGMMRRRGVCWINERSCWTAAWAGECGFWPVLACQTSSLTSKLVWKVFGKQRNEENLWHPLGPRELVAILVSA